MGKQTYFIPKNELQGTCYFEFQIGKHVIGGIFKKGSKHWLDSSLYLSDLHIAPFAYLISGRHHNIKAAKSFDFFGITYIDESDGKTLIENLHKFADLLEQGKKVYEALETMKYYDPTIDGSWREEDNIKELDLIVLRNTAEELADWTEKTLKSNKVMSILGI